MATNSLIFFSPKYVGVYQLVGRKVLTALTENIGSNTMPISGSKLRDSSHFSLQILAFETQNSRYEKSKPHEETMGRCSR